ncbi:hypothetical protein BRCON_0982 [Candidatus Sumerlaea chitinivorans]|uniref:Uncharacterized protein n=1 Tax=Sumerlaea chitinivorans TaxID=2250252 RepID=A0A2Z4Y440_SUMC1|nr:hypothetical protein BRCON_0982 [Candidatus Sumerlaea chitinivorans]
MNPFSQNERFAAKIAPESEESFRNKRNVLSCFGLGSQL